VITIFDHRGCQRGGPNAEYTGPKSNDQDDEMCVKVQSKIIGANNNAKAIAQVDSFSCCCSARQGILAAQLSISASALHLCNLRHFCSLL
jgi:hypothetical protein